MPSESPQPELARSSTWRYAVAAAIVLAPTSHVAADALPYRYENAFLLAFTGLWGMGTTALAYFTWISGRRQALHVATGELLATLGLSGIVVLLIVGRAADSHDLVDVSYTWVVALTFVTLGSIWGWGTAFEFGETRTLRRAWCLLAGWARVGAILVYLSGILFAFTRDPGRSDRLWWRLLVALLVVAAALLLTLPGEVLRFHAWRKRRAGVTLPTPPPSGA